MISLHVLENLIQMITVRIRNENLPEMVTGNQFHNSLNPLSIQLIRGAKEAYWKSCAAGK